MKFRCLAYLLVFTLQLQAQQRHYILLQTETGTPFTVKLNEQTYQSSTAGHVIIPRLISNRYNIELKVSNNSGTYFFSCLIGESDLAYTVKDYGVKGWGLQEMHTKQVMLAATEPIKDAGIAGNSVFTDMLMQAAGDTTLNKKITVPEAVTTEKDNSKIVATEKPVPDTDAEIQQAIDSVSQLQALEDAAEKVKLEETTSIKNDQTVDTVVVVEETAKVPVTDTMTIEYTKPSFEDQATEAEVTVDTVVTAEIPAAEIFIPADTVKPVIDNPFYKPDITEPQQDKANSQADIVATVVEKEAEKTETVNQSAALQETAPIVATQGALRPGCKEMYPDDGVEKLKRKVVSENSIEGMVQVIIKATNNKCLTTVQVKSLGGLFLSDEGRYTLYDALYSRVYDYGMYSTLEKQIVDPYYKKRFLALLR